MRTLKLMLCLLLCAAIMAAMPAAAFAAEGDGVFSDIQNLDFYTISYSLDGSSDVPATARTQLSINFDGSFVGYFSAHSEDESDEDYPMGTFYMCNFDGQFADYTVIDENSFSLTVKSLEFEPVQEDHISDDGVLYTVCPPAGISEGCVLVFYKNIAELPEALSHLQLSDGAFIIVNEKDGAVFSAAAMLLPW